MRKQDMPMGGGKSSSDKPKRPVVAVEYEEHFVYKSLVEQLGDPSPLRRESACWMLGELRYKAADKVISRLLTQDKDPLVRYGATHALERIADSWAVQAIIRGLKDKDDLVRRACIISLSRLQDKQAVYPLEALIKHEEDEEIRTIAKEALLKINGKKLKNSSSNERKIYKYLRQTELNPDSANAHYNLSVAYFHAKRFKESKQHCDQARQLGANVGWLVDQLAGNGASSSPENSDDGNINPVDEANESPVKTADSADKIDNSAAKTNDSAEKCEDSAEKTNDSVESVGMAASGDTASEKSTPLEDSP